MATGNRSLNKHRNEVRVETVVSSEPLGITNEMKKNKSINLKDQEEALKRALADISEQKQKAGTTVSRDLPAAKSSVYHYLAFLDTLGVAEDYKATILKIASDREQEGVRLPILRSIMPNQIGLDKARKELGDQEYIEVVGGMPTTKKGMGFLKERSEGNTITIAITEEGRAAATVD